MSIAKLSNVSKCFSRQIQRCSYTWRVTSKMFTTALVLFSKTLMMASSLRSRHLPVRAPQHLPYRLCKPDVVGVGLWATPVKKVAEAQGDKSVVH